MIKIITPAEALEMKNSLIIDVRSPGEYDNDHILNAINLPILDDQERHEVGIIYKQISREKAIEKGMEFYAPKIPSVHEAVKDHRDKNIIVYCSRGGMRSGIIASLLDSIGFKVFKIQAGYKGFRNYMVEKISNYKLTSKIVVLWGFSCTAKTEILNKLNNSIDLEGLAQHRGSLMGALGLKPNSQKKFENLLMKKLDQLQEQGEKFIFIEGESRRIGDVIIPPFLYKAMLSGIAVDVKRDMELRVKSLVDEYFKPEHLDEIKEITLGFRRVISNKKKEEATKFIDEGNLHEASRIILNDYYDKLYEHTLNEIDYAFEINADDVDKAVMELKRKLSKLNNSRASQS